MAERPAFHAAPPPGHWINDPNGLVYAEGAYRLFAQHRADAPDFLATGWARFSSPDLLAWTFDGAVVPPEGSDWAYSGCVRQDGEALEAVHTAHDGRLERQVLRTSRDAGATWSGPAPLPALGAPARNRRDPFVFADGDGWALLLAEPCDWADWEQEPPSRLRLYRSPDRRAWREAGVIGPWAAPGVMWEVPLLLRLDGRDVLVVSEVDRRSGAADCAVRAWVGTLAADGFAPADPVGQPVDLGPDFYALMTGSGPGWPHADPACVAWASNWNTARSIGWPGFHGGPITLPRRLGVEAGRVTNRPHPAVAARFTRRVDGAPPAGVGRLYVGGDQLRLTLDAGSAAAAIAADWRTGTLGVDRSGPAPWRRETPFTPSAASPRAIELYLDGPCAELFLLDEGLSLTIALPGDRPAAVSAELDGVSAKLSWSTTPRQPRT